MKKEKYIENIMGRDFYDFYRKSRRKPSKVIDQYNYFEKAVHGMIEELRNMMSETEYGIHLKGLGVLYRKPFGEIMQKVDIFTHTKINRKTINFYIEDDYIRRRYLMTNMMNISSPEKKAVEDKSTAILLHRKLKLKK